MATYSFQFRVYHRPFRVPLRTHYGEWVVRQGVIVQLSQAERVGWGEIAPIAWFGTETLEQALEFCRSLPAKMSEDDLVSRWSCIPDALPCCQFGLISAWESLHRSPHPIPWPRWPSSDLLPSGIKALQEWKPLWQTGTRTFKWKIGTAPIASELTLFEQLMQTLPPGVKLRLDANGGLSWEEANRWLARCDGYGRDSLSSATIEFLEQPLPSSSFPALQRLSQSYQTPIALDESVTTVGRLSTCLHQGWRGPVVIKAAIAGSPEKLRQVCRTYAPDIIWSSSFETAIGRSFIEQSLMAEFPSPRASGFGIDHWFAPSRLDALAASDPGNPSATFEHLWQSL